MFLLRHRYDLVVASYVLAELRTPGERRRAVAQLWGRTSPRGALLLVEPGTPIGSANVREARTQVGPPAVHLLALHGACNILVLFGPSIAWAKTYKGPTHWLCKHWEGPHANGRDWVQSVHHRWHIHETPLPEECRHSLQHSSPLGHIAM